MYTFKVPKQSISVIIPKVYKADTETLKDIFVYILKYAICLCTPLLVWNTSTLLHLYKHYHNCYCSHPSDKGNLICTVYFIRIYCSSQIPKTEDRNEMALFALPIIRTASTLE